MSSNTRQFETVKLGDLPKFKKLYAKLTKDRVEAVKKALAETDQCIENGEISLADLVEEPEKE